MFWKAVLGVLPLLIACAKGELESVTDLLMFDDCRIRDGIILPDIDNNTKIVIGFCQNTTKIPELSDSKILVALCGDIADSLPNISTCRKNNGHSNINFKITVPFPQKSCLELMEYDALKNSSCREACSNAETGNAEHLCNLLAWIYAVQDQLNSKGEENAPATTLNVIGSSSLSKPNALVDEKPIDDSVGSNAENNKEKNVIQTTSTQASETSAITAHNRAIPNVGSRGNTKDILDDDISVNDKSNTNKVKTGGKITPGQKITVSQDVRDGLPQSSSTVAKGSSLTTSEKHNSIKANTLQHKPLDIKSNKIPKQHKDAVLPKNINKEPNENAPVGKIAETATSSMETSTSTLPATISSAAVVQKADLDQSDKVVTSITEIVAEDNNRPIKGMNAFEPPSDDDYGFTDVNGDSDEYKVATDNHQTYRIHKTPEFTKIESSAIQNAFPAQEDNHFFFYFIFVITIVATGYLVFHNKQKIIALIVEGRHERRRRPLGVSYRKLETK